LQQTTHACLVEKLKRKIKTTSRRIEHAKKPKNQKGRFNVITQIS
jgi:hypothetical protein